jgi:hypothetical protein
MGFILEEDEAQHYFSLSDDNRDCIFRFMIGDDLNNEPLQTATRWVIDFRDLPLEECKAKWPLVLDRIRKLVKPIRDVQKDKRAREKWWCHYRPASSLYEATRHLSRFLATCEVTKFLSFSFIRPGWVLSSNIDVIAFSDEGHFAVLQSTLHDVWARSQCSHLETRLKYSNGNAFETFPLPAGYAQAVTIGKKFLEFRQQVMLSRKCGLTKTYNSFHDLSEKAEDIILLRQLQVEMDHAVSAAYGWSDIDFNHGFHETEQGLRYTISKLARHEILVRLLSLNRQRHAEEDAEEMLLGKQPKATGKRGRKATAQDAHGGVTLFSEVGDQE